MQLLSINPDGTVDLAEGGRTYHLTLAQFRPCHEVSGAITMAGVLTANVTGSDGIVTQTAFPTLGGSNPQRIVANAAMVLGVFPSSLAAKEALAAWIIARGGQLAFDPQSL